MIGVYIPLECHASIYYIDNPELDVWKLQCETESEVGIDGKSEVRTDLRRSKSMRNKFNMKYPPDDVRLYFEKIHIGTGSMHVYEDGDFMKPHTDQRLDDHEGLPHVMTLIVSNDMLPLRINGNQLDNSFNMVLFSLDCKHEVVPVLGRRRSFTFPVYGTYNPFCHYKQHRAIGTNLYDELLQRINDEDPEDSELRPLIGALKTVLDIKEINLLTALHLFNDGDGVYEDEDPRIPLENTVETYISYTADGAERKEKITTDLSIPVATNIKFEEKITHPGYHVFDVLRKAVLREKDYAEAAYEKICRQEVKELPDDALKTLPNYPIIIALIGRYFSDSTTDSLVPEDRAIYNLVSKTKRTISLSVAYEWSCRDKCFLEFSGGKFVPAFDQNRRRGHLQIDELNVEFDDMHSYDASYKRCRGVLIVE